MRPQQGRSPYMMKAESVTVSEYESARRRRTRRGRGVLKQQQGSATSASGECSGKDPTHFARVSLATKLFSGDPSAAFATPGCDSWSETWLERRSATRRSVSRMAAWMDS